MRIAVSCSNSIDSQRLVFRVLDESQMNPALIMTEMLNGHYNKGDRFARLWAERRRIPVLERPIDWSLGSAAGARRNRDMLKEAGGAVAIWDGISRDTYNFIVYAQREYKRPIHIYQLAKE